MGKEKPDLERPEATGGAEGEVVTPQNSEFQTLKLRIKELEDIEVEEKEDKITIKSNELRITLENTGEAYDYWVWTIEALNIKIFISSTNQSLYVFEKTKTYTVNAEISINYSYVEQDLFICTKSEFTIEEIVEIIKVFREKGEQGLFEKFIADYQVFALI